MNRYTEEIKKMYDDLFDEDKISETKRKAQIEERIKNKRIDVGL